MSEQSSVETAPPEAPPGSTAEARASPRPPFVHRLAQVAIPLLVVAVAGWLVRHELARMTWPNVLAAVATMHPVAVAASVAFTAASYGCLAACEYYAFRYLGARQTLGKAVMVSLPANALANGLGFGLMTGTAVRLRLYREPRRSLRAITGVVVRLSASAFLGGLVTMGLALLLHPAGIGAVIHSRGLSLLLGLILVAPAAAWFATGPRRTGAGAPLRPHERLLALAASIGDWVFSAAALYVLSPHPEGGFPKFVVTFLLGSLIGSVAGVPGAVGPLDAVFLGGLSTLGSLHESAAALLIYRVIFLVGPLLLAIAGLSAVAMLRLMLRSIGRRR